MAAALALAVAAMTTTSTTTFAEDQAAASQLPPAAIPPGPMDGFWTEKESDIVFELAGGEIKAPENASGFYVHDVGTLTLINPEGIKPSRLDCALQLENPKRITAKCDSDIGPFTVSFDRVKKK